LLAVSYHEYAQATTCDRTACLLMTPANKNPSHGEWRNVVWGLAGSAPAFAGRPLTTDRVHCIVSPQFFPERYPPLAVPSQQ
jgi:hypothetical protein